MPKFEFPKLTVLVVDDQDFVRNIVVQILKKLGVGRVLQSSDGAEALEILEKTTPDLILCDIKMKPVDGLQFLHDVRGGLGGPDPEVPIIFLTSATDQDTVRAAIEGDIDGYLVKPVAPADLKAKIIAVLGKRMISRGVPWS